MRLTLALLIAALSTASSQAAPPELAVEVKDAVARVTVVPEDRADIRVEMLTTNPRLPLEVRTTRSRTIVDGKLDPKRIRACRTTPAGAVVTVARLGEVAWRDMPQIVVRTPRDVTVAVGGAVYGSVGRSRNLSLGAAGCGDWAVANVEQVLHLGLAGSGDTRAGSAGEARLQVAGSGGLGVAEVRGPLTANLAGSGDIRVRQVNGPLDIHMAGSGDVLIEGGRASAMTVSMAGSGDVAFNGVADSLSARIAGSGDVRVGQVRGSVSSRVLGSGRVRIGGL